MMRVAPYMQRASCRHFRLWSDGNLTFAAAEGAKPKVANKQTTNGRTNHQGIAETNQRSRAFGSCEGLGSEAPNSVDVVHCCALQGTVRLISSACEYIYRVRRSLAHCCLRCAIVNHKCCGVCPMPLS
jgi:hypothetical protein